MSDQERDTGTLHSFSQLLTGVDEGNMHHELTEEIRNLVAALNEARADGTKNPVAKIRIDMELKLDGNTVDVVADYVATPPKKPKRGKSVYWTTADNRLSRNNPRQQALPFKAVAEPIAAPKAV